MRAEDEMREATKRFFSAAVFQAPPCLLPDRVLLQVPRVWPYIYYEVTNLYEITNSYVRTYSYFRSSYLIIPDALSKGQESKYRPRHRIRDGARGLSQTLQTILSQNPVFRAPQRRFLRDSTRPDPARPQTSRCRQERQNTLPRAFARNPPGCKATWRRPQ